MKSSYSPLQEINLAAKLADLSETNFQNTVMVHALIELLAEKGLLTREELLEKANKLNRLMNQQLFQQLRADANLPRFPS